MNISISGTRLMYYLPPINEPNPLPVLGAGAADLVAFLIALTDLPFIKNHLLFLRYSTKLLFVKLRFVQIKLYLIIVYKF